MLWAAGGFRVEAREEAKMTGGAQTMQARLIEIAKQGDIAWFAANPDRRIRIRQAVAQEFADDIGASPVGMTWFALVLEAQPGARIRQPIALPIGFAIDDMDDAALFSLFQQAAPADAKALLSRLRTTRLPNA
ncbi:hypothetical protein ASE72_12445 [Sphingomonas sp. Leaf20]|nr:hypothetical protein ASE72_12445 [Sphingomonas sp. Leaf20]